MAYGDFKDFARTTAADKVLHDKAFSIAKNPKYDGYKEEYLLWFIIFFLKRLQVVVSGIKSMP